MWFWLSLLFAIWISVGMIISKHVLRGVSPSVLSAALAFLTVPFLLLITLATAGGIPSTDWVFWFGVLGSAFLNVFATLLSYTAIKHAPVSILAPIASFNPLFTALFAFAFLGENLKLAGVIGIVLIVVGSYFLNIKDIKHSLFRPFSVLFGNRFVRFFLLANFIWAITPIFEKTAILHTVPQSGVFAAAAGSSLLFLFLIPVVKKGVPKPFLELGRNWKWFILLSILGAVGYWAAFTAYSLANLGYVTSVFRLSIIFTIFWGWLFFKEERIKERLLGAIVMITGTILLVL
ncbi:MAG: DMT family transporter [Candidatus Levybacteria bacterium]|nr:DMT family transporter [Candidatus Levybacteria bacterium]